MARRILVVDDEEDLRMTLCSLLNLLGYEVDAAQDGLDALEKVTRNAPDLVITDIRMPKCDGIELQKRLEALAPPMIPMLFISGYVGAEELNLDSRPNFAGFLAKPFSIDALTSILNSLPG